MDKWIIPCRAGLKLRRSTRIMRSFNLPVPVAFSMNFYLQPSPLRGSSTALFSTLILEGKSCYDAARFGHSFLYLETFVSYNPPPSNLRNDARRKSSTQGCDAIVAGKQGFQNEGQFEYATPPICDSRQIAYLRGKHKTIPCINLTADIASIDRSTSAASSHEIHHVDDEKRSIHEEGDIEKGPTLDAGIEKEETRDPNIVDWDGPDDPENPLNWTTKKKLTATISIALITLLTYAPPPLKWLSSLTQNRPLGSSMFAPGVGQLVTDFKITSIELSSFVVSVYLLGYCFGPLLIAPVSEIYGRRIVYNVCNILYVIWTIACAVAPEIGSLTVFRFFAGCAGSCPLTIGAGSIADMFVQERRGSAMAAWALGPLIGPVIGPVGMSI